MSNKDRTLCQFVSLKGKQPSKKKIFFYVFFLRIKISLTFSNKPYLDLGSLSSLDLNYIFRGLTLRSCILKVQFPGAMSHTRVHRRIRRTVGMRSQSQSAQAVHGGAVEGAMVNVSLMMMVRWQTHVRQAAVRGEAVAAGGRGGLHRIMLRRRSPIVAVRILRCHLGSSSCALRRFRVALRRMLRGMRHPDGAQRQRGLHLPARRDATIHRRASLVPSELRPPVLEPHLHKKNNILLTVLLSPLSILEDEILSDWQEWEMIKRTLGAQTGWSRFLCATAIIYDKRKSQDICYF